MGDRIGSDHIKQEGSSAISVLDCITQAIVVNNVITNHTTGTPIIHVEASFISVERGLHREILSQTSLKCYIHFSFILKLIIFHLQTTQKACSF